MAVTGLAVTACASGGNYSDGFDVHGAPHNLRWTEFQGVAVPVGDEGPHEIDGPVATGYAATPAGAALAAIETEVRVSVADDSQWPQVGQRLLAQGPGRDAWATARAQVSIPDPVANGQAPRVVGYVITHYSPTVADIDVYTRQVDASMTRNAVTVVRRGEDWLVDLSAHPTPSVAAVAETPRDMVALSASGGVR